MSMKKNLLFYLLPLTLFLHFGIVSAELIVLQARGGVKVGRHFCTKKIVLKEGERVTLIGPDGKVLNYVAHLMMFLLKMVAKY